MVLPSRLSSSTLGDLLGRLHRGRVTGVVELVEIRNTSGRGIPGRTHRIVLEEGAVADVETSLSSSDVVACLEALFRHFSFEDASVRFRVARRGQGMRRRALVPREYLHGRPRARDRGGAADPRHAPADVERARALSLLGLGDGVDDSTVRKAFRRLARDLHPDRHVLAPEWERGRLTARFGELAAAYHVLLAS